MTLRIERNSDGRRTLIRLIGRVRSEHLEELKKQTGVKGPPIPFCHTDLELMRRYMQKQRKVMTGEDRDSNSTCTTTQATS